MASSTPAKSATNLLNRGGQATLQCTRASEAQAEAYDLEAAQVGGILFQRREYDVFASYRHADAGRVAPVVHLLKKAGLKVWFDAESGNAATPTSDLLSDNIGNSRGAVFFLSKAWTQSTWCKKEFDRSLSEESIQNEFSIVAMRLDDVEVPGWFEVAEILDFRNVTPAGITRLLCSLGGRRPRRVDNEFDVYLSAPWSKRTPLTDLALDALRQPALAWRLVGDSPSHQHFGSQRIEAIVRTTRGMVAVLPHDPSKPEHGYTSKFILKEAEDAIATGKLLLLLSEPGVAVPDGLVAKAFRSLTLDPSPDAEAKLKEALIAFDERIQQEPHDRTGAFIFYGGSLKDRVEGVESVIERSSNMLCIRGERLSGANAQVEIVGLIRRAALVIADVSEGRRNTLIEAGVAMGSDTPMRLMARNSDTGAPPKQPFMFGSREVIGYNGPEEQLCLCFDFARRFRRRVYFG